MLFGRSCTRRAVGTRECTGIRLAQGIGKAVRCIFFRQRSGLGLEDLPHDLVVQIFKSILSDSSRGILRFNGHASE